MAKIKQLSPEEKFRPVELLKVRIKDPFLHNARVVTGTLGQLNNAPYNLYCLFNDYAKENL